MVNARSFLVNFKFSHKVTYVVEFSHNKIRLYSEGKPVYSGGGIGPTASISGDTAYASMGYNVIPSGISAMSDTSVSVWDLLNDEENILTLESPYAYADLWDNDEQCFKLQTIQHSDMLYIFSENHPIYVLKRYANLDWRLEELELKDGPFEAMNSESTTMSASAVMGTITLTASSATFSADDVGRLVRLRGYGNEQIWAANVSVTNGDVFASDNKYYQAINTGTTGTHKPVHDEGIRSDGGVRWQYLHDGMGVVEITAYSSATSVSAKVLKRLPEAVTEGTVYWELGLLYKGANYPKSGAFFRNRFAFLVNTKTGPQVCLSVSGDYNNFADQEHGETTAESAITVPVLNTEFNEGKWLFAGDVLFVGTGSGEFYIDVISSTNALANDNVKISQISHVGSKAITPVGVGGHIFFTDRYGLSLRDLSYNYYNDGYDQVDISILGKHLFRSQIVAMSYQEVPYKILWCLTGDGRLAALTFSAEQEVAAISQHDFSGQVESIAVIPHLGAASDELWLEVKRSINGETCRTIEFMELGMPQMLPTSVYTEMDLAKRSKLENTYVLRQARYLDGAVLFVREDGDTRTVLQGLNHLDGEVVSIFSDGAVRPSQIVINGEITIGANDTMVLVGKAITSQYVPQAIYLDDENGSGVGQRQCADHVTLMLYLSGGGKIGTDEAHLSDIFYRCSDGVLNEPTPLFTGNKEILFDGVTDAKGEPQLVLIENSSPMPMNILAIIPHMS